MPPKVHLELYFPKSHAQLHCIIFWRLHVKWLYENTKYITLYDLLKIWRILKNVAGSNLPLRWEGRGQEGALSKCKFPGPHSVGLGRHGEHIFLIIIPNDFLYKWSHSHLKNTAIGSMEAARVLSKEITA